MSVAWNLRLPYLYSSAVPGREWQRLNFAALGEGKTRGTVQEKKRLVCIPTLGTSLRNPPRARPVLSSDPPKKQQQEHCSINVKIRSSTGYLTYLYLSGPITPQKSPTTASTRNFFLPNQPTSRHVVQQCIPDLRHALCLLQGEHTYQIYPSSSTRAVHIVPPEHSQAPLANLFEPRPTS